MRRQHDSGEDMLSLKPPPRPNDQDQNNWPERIDSGLPVDSSFVGATSASVVSTDLRQRREQLQSNANQIPHGADQDHIERTARIACHEFQRGSIGRATHETATDELHPWGDLGVYRAGNSSFNELDFPWNADLLGEECSKESLEAIKAALAEDQADILREEAASAALVHRLIQEQERSTSEAVARRLLQDEASEEVVRKLMQEHDQAISEELVRKLVLQEREEVESKLFRGGKSKYSAQYEKLEKSQNDKGLDLSEQSGDNVKEEIWALLAQHEMGKVDLRQYNSADKTACSPSTCAHTCLICQSDYKDNDLLRKLPCSHYYHVLCAETWLRIRDCCPLCRAVVEST